MAVGRLLVALVLASTLLASASASAGTPDEPDIRDGRDQSSPSVDLLAAWFENEPHGLRFTVQVAGFDDDLRSHAFFVGFRTSGGRHVGNIVFDRDGEVHTIAAATGYGSQYDGPDSYPDNVVDVRVDAGQPATVSGVIPWGAVPGFEPGRVLTSLYAGTDDGSSRSRDYVDIAQTRRTFTLEAVDGPVGLASRAAAVAAPAGLTMLATTVLGAGAAFVLARPFAPRPPTTNGRPPQGAPPPTSPPPASPPRLRPPE